MAAIARAVAERFGVPSGLLFTACRQHQISHPRQVAMYLCRKHTNNSLAAIGRFFGGKNHTTVMHALRHVEHELSVNFELRRFVEVFSEQCRDPPIRMGSPIVLPAEIPAEIPAHLKKPGALKAAIALRDELAVSEKYPGSVIPDEDRDYEKAFDEIFGCEKASFSAPLEELLKMRYEEK